ncbi:MAG: type VII toxin-antitoxin system MntA family adenylyltransferase antitoxin [bacterium]
MVSLSTDEARRFAERAAAVLATDPRVRLVYLFGSAADPDVQRARDVDLGVSTDPPLNARELLELRTALVNAVGAPIDLVSLDRAPVVLAKEVADYGLCLHAEPPEAEVEFVTRARSRYWDFKPFLEVQHRYAGERQAARRNGPQA